MAPYLETVKSFADVTVTDTSINTPEFLEACKGLVGLFDILGSTAFAAVKTDLNGNIAKVKARYDAFPELSGSLQELVSNEKGEKKRVATEANKEHELSVTFTKGYEETLKKYHNFVVKGIFSVAMKACPYRVDFYKKLAADPDGGAPASDEQVNEALNKWLAALSAIVAQMEAFYAAGEYGKGF